MALDDRNDGYKSSAGDLLQMIGQNEENKPVLITNKETKIDKAIYIRPMINGL